MEVNFKADFERTMEYRRLNRAVEREAKELSVLRQVGGLFVRRYFQLAHRLVIGIAGSAPVTRGSGSWVDQTPSQEKIEVRRHSAKAIIYPPLAPKHQN